MKSPAFQWYPKDYLTSARVQMMTLAEEGAYCRLLNYCWLNGSIPNDDKAIVRLIGKGATVEMARVCMEMFQVSPDDPTLLIHDRLEEEKRKQEDNSEIRRQAAQKRWDKRGTSADARGKQVKSHSDANAMQMDMQTNMQNDAFHISSSSSTAIEKETPIGVSKKKIGTRIPETFELSAEMREYARTRAPNVSVELEHEKFRNYWKAKAGRDGTKLDWAATWRNWILTAQERSNGRNGASGYSGSNAPVGSTSDFLASIGSSGTVI